MAKDIITIQDILNTKAVEETERRVQILCNNLYINKDIVNILNNIFVEYEDEKEKIKFKISIKDGLRGHDSKIGRIVKSKLQPIVQAEINKDFMDRVDNITDYLND